MVMPILVAGVWRRGRGDVYASRYPADDSLNADIDSAYLAKYKRYGSEIVDPMVTPTARATTLKLVPR